MTPAREPLVDRQDAAKRIRQAQAQYNAALRAFDDTPRRLRTLADALDHMSRVITLAELANLPWKPQENARTWRLAAGLDPDADREGPPKLWKQFDQRLYQLGEAMEGTFNSAVAAGFAALRDTITQIAEHLDPTASKDDSDSSSEVRQAS